MKRLIIISIVFLVACSEEDEKENTALKSKLQGKWRCILTSSLRYRFIELSFYQSKLDWKDSTIVYLRHNEKTNGVMDYGRGTNNVYYHYNDGSTPVPGGYEKNYYFLMRNTNDVLWIELGHYVYEFYTLKNGTFTFDLEMHEGYNKHKIGSSTIVFSNNDQTAEFCDVLYYSGYSVCLVFNKIS